MAYLMKPEKKRTKLLPEKKKKEKKPKAKGRAYYEKKADALYQQIGKILSDGVCEVCGGQQQVTHHLVKKSQSTGLRYDIMNGIFLCNSCHCAIHQGKRDNITGIIVANRGAKWMYELETKRKELAGLNYNLLWWKQKYEELTIALEQLKS